MPIVRLRGVRLRTRGDGQREGTGFANPVRRVANPATFRGAKYVTNRWAGFIEGPEAEAPHRASHRKTAEKEEGQQQRMRGAPGSVTGVPKASCGTGSPRMTARQRRMALATTEVD
jgi:hypothetical protein